MASPVRNARRALDRGAADEALVVLWNAVEPARLAGDAGALAEIGALAERIVREGDEAQRRDAERLVEALGTATGAEDAAAPTPTIGDVEVGSEPDATADELEESEEPDRRTMRLVNLLWIAFLVLVVVLNVLRGVGGD